MQHLPTFCGDRYVDVRGSEAGRSWITKDIYVLCYARMYMLDTEGCICAVSHNLCNGVCVICIMLGNLCNVLCYATCVMVGV